MLLQILDNLSQGLFVHFEVFLDFEFCLYRTAHLKFGNVAVGRLVDQVKAENIPIDRLDGQVTRGRLLCLVVGGSLLPDQINEVPPDQIMPILALCALSLNHHLLSNKPKRLLVQIDHLSVQYFPVLLWLLLNCTRLLLHWLGLDGGRNSWRAERVVVLEYFAVPHVGLLDVTGVDPAQVLQDARDRLFFLGHAQRVSDVCHCELVV